MPASVDPFVCLYRYFHSEIFVEVGLASNGARGGPLFNALTIRGRVKASEDCGDRVETRI